MGIGSGTDVGNSGERSVAEMLANKRLTEITVFDIGANKGQFLAMVQSNLGAQLKEIHCFEPAATTFKTLSKNVTASDEIHLNNIGLSSEAGTAKLYYDKENSGLASLTKRELAFRNIEFGQEEEVSLSTVDDYCKDHGIDRIHWLKLDIEGHELDALRGASGMFGRKAIEIVTFEFGGCNIDTRTFFRDFFDFFSSIGMTIHRITPSGHFQPITRYRETEEQFNTVNFVAYVV